MLEYMVEKTNAIIMDLEEKLDIAAVDKESETYLLYKQTLENEVAKLSSLEDALELSKHVHIQTKVDIEIKFNEGMVYSDGAQAHRRETLITLSNYNEAITTVDSLSDAGIRLQHALEDVPTSHMSKEEFEGWLDEE